MAGNREARVCGVLCKLSHAGDESQYRSELLEKALGLGGERTERGDVDRALQEFIARRGQQRLLNLFGKLEWDDGDNYKRERTRK